MGTFRAFVGIGLPESYQQALAGLRDRLRPVAGRAMRFTRPGNWHLTLKFLGEIPESGLPDLADALGGVAFAPFALVGGGGGFFPDARRPRVAWIGLTEGAEACARLARVVDAALAPLGYPPEGRPFAAHLTVARLREPGSGWDVAAVSRELAAVALPAVTVAGLTLWRSVLGPAGPRYEILAMVAAGQGERRA